MVLDIIIGFIGFFLGVFVGFMMAGLAAGSRYYFDSVVTADADSTFVICGVSNSVSSTINNMLKENITPKVFMPGIISNDGCKTFNEFVKENQLEKTT